MKTQIPPVYGTDESLMCGTMIYNLNGGGKTGDEMDGEGEIITERMYLLDFKDKDDIINSGYKPLLNNIAGDEYPIFKNISLIQFIYPIKNAYIFFINNNKYDLRHTNIKLYHNYHTHIQGLYGGKNIEYIQGNIIKNIIINPLWHIDDTYYLHCESDNTNTPVLASLCDITYRFYIQNSISRGYIWIFKNGAIIDKITNIKLQYILYDKSASVTTHGEIPIITHIDLNVLNNKYTNLQITPIIFGCSTGAIKKQRKHNARQLPDGVDDTMLHKHVVYYKDNIPRKDGNTLYREYFKVEHPKLTTPWCSSKSRKISIFDKLQQANLYAIQLESQPISSTDSQTSTEEAIQSCIFE